MNLKAGQVRNSTLINPSSSVHFLSLTGEVLRTVLLGFFKQRFLPIQKKNLKEKRLISLDRRGGYSPKTGNSQIDYDLRFRLPAGFHFWPVNCHLTNLNLSGSPVLFRAMVIYL